MSELVTAKHPRRRHTHRSDTAILACTDTHIEATLARAHESDYIDAASGNVFPRKECMWQEALCWVYLYIM